MNYLRMGNNKGLQKRFFESNNKWSDDVRRNLFTLFLLFFNFFSRLFLLSEDNKMSINTFCCYMGNVVNLCHMEWTWLMPEFMLPFVTQSLEDSFDSLFLPPSTDNRTYLKFSRVDRHKALASNECTRVPIAPLMWM